MWNMFYEHSVMYPALYDFLLRLEMSLPEIKMQFFMDPTAFPEIQEIWELLGQSAFEHILYLTRTYAYYLYRQKQILLGWWTSDNFRTKYHKKRDKRDRPLTIVDKYSSNTSNNTLITGNPAPDVSAIYHHQTAVPPTSPEVSTPVHQPIATDQYIPVVQPLRTPHPVTSTLLWPNHEGLFGGQPGTWCCCSGVGCTMCIRGPKTQSGFPNQKLLYSNPYLLPVKSDPLPGHGQAGVCDVGVGGLQPGSQQPLSHL
jgi:hypothetical protein